MQLRMKGPFLLPLLAAALFFPGLLPAQVQDRITQPMQASESQPVRGNVHPLARPEDDQGAVAGSMMLRRMVMTFTPSATQQNDLRHCSASSKTRFRLTTINGSRRSNMPIASG